MQAFNERIRRFLTREDGPTAVEYAVMLALILITCVVAVASLGDTVNSLFTESQAKAFGTTKGG
ncbi:MAG: Flp family type IVb pilin [Isosphaeraceae bacterium]